MMLESTDAKVHFIYHTPQMAEARGRGGLRANRSVRLHKLFEDGRPLLEIDERGHSEKVLNDERHLEETRRLRIQGGMIPIEDAWGGWLGRYQAALRSAASAPMHQRDFHGRAREPDRGRGR
jgi:hypothetical protein